MYKLINPIKPFGANTAEISECDESTYNWLIETGKCEVENFELVEIKTKKTNK